MGTWEDVARAVKDRRYQLELSQRKAAAASGISTTTWNRLEVKALPVDSMTRLAVARVLQWPADIVDQILTTDDVAALVGVLTAAPAEQTNAHDALDHHDEQRAGIEAGLRDDRILRLELDYEALKGRVEDLESRLAGGATPALLSLAADVGVPADTTITDASRTRRRVGPADGE